MAYLKAFYVYIMNNRKRGVLYIGFTNDIFRRTYEHKHKIYPGFTKRYNLKYLVYFEEVGSIDLAITREKQLKNWHRDWKINLIRQMNPDMRDLGAELLGLESGAGQSMDAETSSA